jgi:hypothetical protein
MDKGCLWHHCEQDMLLVTLACVLIGSWTRTGSRSRLEKMIELLNGIKKCTVRPWEKKKKKTNSIDKVLDCSEEIVWHGFIMSERKWSHHCHLYYTLWDRYAHQK